uniref:Reverse transcriptase Ty1/copia-type domain-containing protein n=1 Tax=Lactuca sativa TaxID=4236 RepID=A0A9R1UTJ7_LACSA|nr:hypothetical protein LSAT_V11C800407000 [Lactuca sativa]
MSDLGKLLYYLRIEVHQHEGGITLKQPAYAKTLLKKMGIKDYNACQPAYAKTLLKKTGIKDYNACQPTYAKTLLKKTDSTEYRSVVGAPRHLTHTRPYISNVVELVSRFMERPTVQQLKVVKHNLRYVKGAVDYGLIYERVSGEDIVIGYTNNDYSIDVNDRRCTGGMTFYLSVNLVTRASQVSVCYSFHLWS